MARVRVTTPTGPSLVFVVATLVGLRWYFVGPLFSVLSGGHLLEQDLPLIRLENIEGFEVHSPCPEAQSSSSYKLTASEEVSRFQTSPQDTWRLTRRVSDGAVGASYYSLEFQLLECPPSYMASAFHVQAVTVNTVFAGKVGPRQRIEKGCGYYNVSVPFVFASVRNKSQPSSDVSDCVSAPVAVEAFWTSNYRNYANRVDDNRVAAMIKEQKDNLTTDEIREMVGEDRLKFLQRHLDVLPGFPLSLTLPADDVVDEIVPQGTMDALPDCSDVPMVNWLPVGVMSSRPDDDTSWQFHSWRCRYRTWSRDELNHLLAGLRVRFLADSHGQFENTHVQKIVCPEAVTKHTFFEENYECPQHNNTFVFGWRFYRGVYLPSRPGVDYDNIAMPMRTVQPSACKTFLGVGFFNVTIITTPTWLFVYETEEALHEYVRSIGDLIQLCRRLHPSEMEDLVILLQTPTASDVHPKSANLKDAADDWRGKHNFRQEMFNSEMYNDLLNGGLVDGIVPAFEWTLARNWKERTKDGTHLAGQYYEDVFHLQTSAILSAMKFRKRRGLPLMSEDDPRARWFVGHALEPRN